jgi:cardiolipin synthase
MTSVATPNASSRSLPAPPRDLLAEVAGALALPITGAASLAVEHSGDAHFSRLLAAVAAARSEVAIEIYQILPDEVGLTVAAALAAAARRGVRVRLLADAWGSREFAGELATLSSAGVETRWYGPLRPGVSPLRRTHRKLIVVDGGTASVGGMNLTRDFSERLSRGDAWRDVSLWLTGPAAAVLSAQLDTAWSGRTLPAGHWHAGTRESAARCAVVGGADGRSGHALAYRALADAARREILIANPYFLPDADFRRRLLAAAARGVRVRVVVPRRCDVKPFKHASRRLYAPLLRGGIEIYERDDRMVHAKVAVVDRSVAAVGSTNINRRSFYWNSETLILSDDRKMVSDIVDFVLLESTFVAEPLSLARWRRHPDRRRVAELVAASVHLLF